MATTTTTMTLDDINALMAGQRERGGHEKELRGVIARGELYCEMNNLSRYASKTTEQFKALTNQLNAIAKKNELNLRVIHNPDGNQPLLCVNLDVHAAQLAAKEGN